MTKRSNIQVSESSWGIMYGNFGRLARKARYGTAKRKAVSRRFWCCPVPYPWQPPWRAERADPQSALEALVTSVARGIDNLDLVVAIGEQQLSKHRKAIEIFDPEALVEHDRRRARGG